MSIVVRFHPTNVTIAQYEDVLRREQGAGAKFPPDRQGLPHLLRN